MKVTLLARSPDMLDVVASCARGCYSAKPATELIHRLKPNQIKGTLAHTHGSTLEHASFTFSIEGVSRALTHQLVRHRLASFSQQSQRYVKIEDILKLGFVIPPEIEGTREMRFASEFWTMHQAYFDTLGKLIIEGCKIGLADEDLRYYLPAGIQTNITMTMNLRELRHFLGLRCCQRAQWEIRELANTIKDLVEREEPELIAFFPLGANCEQEGFCPEKDKSCGRYPTKSALIQFYNENKHP